MTKRVALLALVAALAAPSAFAVGTNDGLTCPNARDIGSNAMGVATNTCTAGNPIGAFGLLPSPHNDFIYTFIAQGANATISVPTANYDYGVLLTAACNGDSGLPLNATTGPAPGGSFMISGLTNGTRYWLVVTGNPGSGTTVCGTSTINVTGTLPVSLQGFSVE